MNVHEMARLSTKELQKVAQSSGNTPLEPVLFVIDGRRHVVHLKLEEFNPTGSAKDRTGKGLMQALEEQELLRKDSILIESTSGNLGVALSFWCKVKGYQFLAVVDPKTTGENIEKMKLLGAEIEMVEERDRSGSYLLSRLERVQMLCRSSARYVWPNQYGNTANPHVHYRETGPEIYQQMHGRVDAIFLAVSTGGTLAGVSRFFRERSPRTQIIAVDARGSVIFGTPPGPRLLTGIGSSQSSRFLTRDLYDEFIQISDQEAFTYCRAMAWMTGRHIGGSSGAVIAACTRYLQAHPEVERVVSLCADGGNNYLTTIYNDDWMQLHRFSLDLDLPEYVHAVECSRCQYVTQHMLSKQRR